MIAEGPVEFFHIFLSLAYHLSFLSPFLLETTPPLKPRVLGDTLFWCENVDESVGVRSCL